jgi:hypothetical protein
MVQSYFLAALLAALGLANAALVSNSSIPGREDDNITAAVEIMRAADNSQISLELLKASQANSSQHLSGLIEAEANSSEHLQKLIEAEPNSSQHLQMLIEAEANSSEHLLWFGGNESEELHKTAAMMASGNMTLEDLKEAFEKRKAEILERYRRKFQQLMENYKRNGSNLSSFNLNLTVNITGILAVYEGIGVEVERIKRLKKRYDTEEAQVKRLKDRYDNEEAKLMEKKDELEAAKDKPEKLARKGKVKVQEKAMAWQNMTEQYTIIVAQEALDLKGAAAAKETIKKAEIPQVEMLHSNKEDLLTTAFPSSDSCKDWWRSASMDGCDPRIIVYVSITAAAAFTIVIIIIITIIMVTRAYQRHLRQKSLLPLAAEGIRIPCDEGTKTTTMISPRDGGSEATVIGSPIPEPLQPRQMADLGPPCFDEASCMEEGTLS